MEAVVAGGSIEEVGTWPILLTSKRGSKGRRNVIFRAAIPMLALDLGGTYLVRRKYLNGEATLGNEKG